MEGTTMQLSSQTYDKIMELVAENPTEEVTGFVSRGKGTSLETVVPMRNVSSTPATDYVWSPPEMLARYQEMDQRNDEPVAFYHSHPNGRSDPSEVDMSSAMQVGMVYLIAYPHYIHHHDDEPKWRMSAWLCIETGILIGEPLDIL